MWLSDAPCGWQRTFFEQLWDQTRRQTDLTCPGEIKKPVLPLSSSTACRALLCLFLCFCRFARGSNPPLVDVMSSVSSCWVHLSTHILHIPSAEQQRSEREISTSWVNYGHKSNSLRALIDWRWPWLISAILLLEKDSKFTIISLKSGT